MASPLGFSHLDPVTLQVIIKETDALSLGEDKKTPRRRDKIQKSQAVSIDVEPLKQPEKVQEVHKLPIEKIHAIFEQHGFHMKTGDELKEIFAIEVSDLDKIRYLIEPPSLPISSRLALAKKMKEIEAMEKELDALVKQKDAFYPPHDQENLFHCMKSLSAIKCEEQHPTVKQILLSMSHVVPELFTDAMRIAISQKKPNIQSANIQQETSKSSDTTQIEFQVNKMNKMTVPVDKYVKTTSQHAKELLTTYPNVVIAQYLMWSRQSGYIRVKQGEFAVLTRKDDATHFVNALNVHFGDTSEGVDVGLFTPETIQRFFKPCN